MPAIAVACIVLHNLHILSNIGIEDEWIIKTENKLTWEICEEKYEKMMNQG